MPFPSGHFASPSGQYFNNDEKTQDISIPNENFHSNHPYVKGPGYYSNQESNNDAIKSIASQLSRQLRTLGSSATVKVAGNTVTVDAGTDGLTESDIANLNFLASPSANVAVGIGKISTNDSSNGVRKTHINPAAEPGASDVFNQAFIALNKPAKSADIAAGRTSTSYVLPQTLACVDPVIKAVGNGVDTTNKQKLVGQFQITADYWGPYDD
jgi:hypothetical protein